MLVNRKTKTQIFHYFLDPKKSSCILIKYMNSILWSNMEKLGETVIQQRVKQKDCYAWHSSWPQSNIKIKSKTPPLFKDRPQGKDCREGKWQGK